MIKIVSTYIQPNGPVWYMCLKIENCYLKIFVEIRVDEKMCGNARNVV